MPDKEVISIFDYRARKARAEMQKCTLQQKVLDLLVADGFRRDYAVEVAEGRHGGETLQDNKLTQKLNKMLKRIHELSQFGYRLDQTTVLH